MATHIQIGDVSPRIQYTADGTQAVFSYPFAIFENQDLTVYLGDVLQGAGFTIDGAGNTAGGTVTFASAPPAGSVVTLIRDLAIQRTSDFQESGEFRAKVLNDELDYLTAALQQVGDAQSRSVQVAVTETANVNPVLPMPQANSAILWNAAGDGLTNGPGADEISAAQGYAVSAQGAATNAASSSASATASANAAANSAQAAATAAASNMYASNETKNADFSVQVTDDGKQFLIDTTAGAVTVTLPEGALATDGFRIALAKTSADGNAVIVNRSGTDTINGGTSWQFSVPHGQAVITLDTTPTPDTWFAAGVGVTAPVGVSDLHENARPYDIAFAAGYDSQFTPEPLAVRTYAKLTMVRPGAFVGESASIETGPAGGSVVMNIYKNGVSIYTTAPQIPDGTTSLSPGTLKTDGTQNFMAGDVVTFLLNATGVSNPGAGLTFSVKGVLG